MSSTEHIPASWLVYSGYHNDVASITNVDPAWHDDPAQRRGFPVFLCVSIRPANEQPTATLSFLKKNKLESTCKQMRKLVAKIARAQLIAERTNGYHVEQFYYGPHEGDAQKLTDALPKKNNAVLVNLRIQNDPLWTQYDQGLYPDQIQQQIIQNKIYSQKMAASGDHIQSPRRVNHYLSFPNQDSRRDFVSAIHREGYVVHEEFYTPDDEFSHGICVRNMTAIDYASINACTTLLIQIASKYHGHYDFWDCPIIRI